MKKTSSPLKKNRNWRKKVDQLVKALDGNVTDHHRFPLKRHLAHIDFLIEQIKEFAEEIRKRRPTRPNSKIFNLLKIEFFIFSPYIFNLSLLKLGLFQLTSACGIAYTNHLCLV